jgi:hypothetical protein
MKLATVLLLLTLFIVFIVYFLLPGPFLMK